MGCGSSASLPQDPEKFPTHLLFQLTLARIKSVSLQRSDELSKEHVFQILLQICSPQMDVISQYKSHFIRLSKDNCSLHLPSALWSISTPLEFWNDAEAGKTGRIKISIWSRQVQSSKAASVDSNATAVFVGDVGIDVGGAAQSQGAAMFAALRDTSRRRIKTETMSPLLLSISEVVQRIDENKFVAKDELNTEVADVCVRMGSCNRSAAELEELLNQHMMEAVHQRRLGQKLLHINEYARQHGMKAPYCSQEELDRMVEQLKASKKTVERSVILQEWSAAVACSCSQIAQLLAIMRYDDERATALAHLILRCYDGHEGSALLRLCDVFDTDAKLESAFQHVNSFYVAHCLDHGFSPAHSLSPSKHSPVPSIKRGGSQSGSEHDDTKSSPSRYSPAPAISRGGSHTDEGSGSQQNGTKSGLSRQPSSAEQ